MVHSRLLGKYFGLKKYIEGFALVSIWLTVKICKNDIFSLEITLFSGGVGRESEREHTNSGSNPVTVSYELCDQDILNLSKSQSLNPPLVREGSVPSRHIY